VAVSNRLRIRLFPPAQHPYCILEADIDRLLGPDSTLLDAGCGRAGELLKLFGPRVRQAVGVDVGDFGQLVTGPNCRYIRADLSRIGLPNASVDIVVSRSVMEHLKDPLLAYRELGRVLKPEGYFVFLTPNLWDYASLLSGLIPNRFHASIVRQTEGRDEADTFPTWYRSNTARTIARLAAVSGFRVASCQYLVQYPNYLRFNTLLFLAGAAYAKTIGRIHQLRHLRLWIVATLQENRSDCAAWRTGASTVALPS
jgi:SAM-dependent methyltransferase